MKYAIKFPSKRQFDLAHGAAVSSRKVAFDNWMAATDPGEKAFYLNLMDEFDALIGLYEAVLISDKSQDAEPEADEDEEED